ncbi:MAG TPA: SDR family oxidoreductase [Bacteroidales bacterium]|nr:SDR family oxidoreductase [Bacteroidales bacterium]
MKIVVNGGTRGIGIEIVRSLASDRNNKIISTGRNIDKLYELSLAYPNIIPLKTDMADFQSHSEEYFKSVSALFDTIDVLINVTGLLINREFTNTSDSDARLIMDVNFFGPASSIKVLRPLMRNGSHIVNISSMGGYLGSSKYKGLAYYSSAKAAISCLTECLAEEFREDGIRVNCLALGSVNTEMLQKAFPGYKAPVSATEMGEFIASFAMNGHKVFNGKVLPVAVTNP